MSVILVSKQMRQTLCYGLLGYVGSAADLGTKVATASYGLVV